MPFRNKIDPPPYSPEEIQESLDELVADGVAYIGADGRYRVREDVQIEHLPDGTILARRKKPQ